MKMQKWAVLLGLIMVSPLLITAQSEWKLAKSGDGIEVYTRNRAEDKIKEFRVTTTVQQPLKRIENLLEDVEAYPTWQDNCEESEVVEKIDNKTVISRYTSSTPFPFSDRDVVLKMTKKPQSDGRVIYQIENAADAIEERDKFVRIPRAGGRWELESKGNSATLVTYQFYADPGGNVPSWLVNMFIVQGPYNSFKQMRELLAN